MNEKSNSFWATIILAAGSSSRMGRAKQLIKIKDETLIQKAVKNSIEAGANRTIVVTGSNGDLIKNELKNFPVDLVANPEWAKGMGSSLKCGLNFVMTQFPEVDGVLILVCDQPFVDSHHLKKMIEEFCKGQTLIVASFYSGKNGVPVLFHKSMFAKLLTIDDQHGAKKLIEENSALVKSIDFPKGVVDLDTPEDLKKI